MRRCSLMSSKALIHPVWWPRTLMSGASKMSTGNRLPSLCMNTDSNPSRAAAWWLPSRMACRCRYSSANSGGQYGAGAPRPSNSSAAKPTISQNAGLT